MGASDGLPNLRYLGISRNQLTGTLPPSWGELNCHVTHASGVPSKNGILPADPSVGPGAQVGCLLWMEHNNFTGVVPKEWCKRDYNEIYIGVSNVSYCPPKCVTTAYAAWPTCKN